jgi:hypothetical protein
MVMRYMGLRTRNHCAGEGQQQFRSQSKLKSCKPAAIQQGCEHGNWRTSMVSSRNLVTPSEDCNQAMTREDTTDGDLACVVVIC